jgi:aminopeptidase
MMDSRIIALARQLVTSVNLQQGEKILIETTDVPSEVPVALVRACKEAGGYPVIRTIDSRVRKAEILATPKEFKEECARRDLEEMKTMDAYIAVRGGDNAFEMSDLPGELSAEYKQIRRPVIRYRVDKTKWCITRWPNGAMAQDAHMSTEAFEDFYFDACLVDYKAMTEAAKPLVELMNSTREVKIVAPGTELTFSIDGIPAVPCCGEKNIPDGEVYTAPVKNSVNGVISYNTPTVYMGIPFSNIRLEFKDGKIVSATCGSGDQAKLDAIFNTDDGAKYVGEFAMGINPKIRRPMCDILFDEKIGGSIHFTPGNAYQDAPNGNSSAIHWDLVLIMHKEYGGGEVYFDGQLIQKDGIFVHPALENLSIGNNQEATDFVKPSTAKPAESIEEMRKSMKFYTNEETKNLKTVGIDPISKGERYRYPYPRWVSGTDEQMYGIVEASEYDIPKNVSFGPYVPCRAVV